jgi:membrane protease YdiL (CAAX protease family)
MEELVFRQGFRNIFGRNIVFILFSGIVFGGMHVIGNINTMADLLYLIPYSALGISFAYMLYKTDNIFVSMGFHFMHNGLLMALQVFILLFS